MIINNNFNIQKLHSINTIFQRKPQISFKGLASDTFERTGSCNADDKSYAELEKWAKESDFLNKVYDYVNKTAPILGSGFEGTTYGIPDNDKWCIKEYKRSNFTRTPVSEPTITEITDISPKLNIGQTIAYVRIPQGQNFSWTYYIMKRQTGKTYGVSHGSSINENNTRCHINQLQKMASYPQSSFDKLVNDIKYMNEIGYVIDTINPNNIMLDDDSHSINFVDINDKKRDNSTQFGNVLFQLLDSEYGVKFDIGDSSDINQVEASEYSQVIIDKFLTAMENNNARFTNDTQFSSLYNSTAIKVFKNRICNLFEGEAPQELTK